MYVLLVNQLLRIGPQATVGVCCINSVTVSSSPHAAHTTPAPTSTLQTHKIITACVHKTIHTCIRGIWMHILFRTLINLSFRTYVYVAGNATYSAESIANHSTGRLKKNTEIHPHLASFSHDPRALPASTWLDQCPRATSHMEHLITCGAQLSRPHLQATSRMLLCL